MTDIRVGDKIRNKGEGPGTGEPGVTRTVTAVGKTKLLYTRTCDGDGWYEHSAFIDQVEKIEPWFEVGKLYERLSGARRCIAIGHYDDTPWAVLVNEPSGYISVWSADVGLWKEVIE